MGIYASHHYIDHADGKLISCCRNHKPSESDMEDDDDEDDEDEDPASWFEDDQDDGRKGQDIIEPDAEDLADIIRVDESRIRYSTFYEPRDEGD